MIGLVSFATPVNAGILSVFGQEAFANTNFSELKNNSFNSQTLALLEADVFSLLPKESKEASSSESVYISRNALVPTSGPLGGSIVSADSGEVYDVNSVGDVSVYVVKKGDTLSEIAEMFEISTDTILSANNMTKKSKLKVGEALLILPFSGVEHTVKKGESLGKIASKYGISIEDIAFFNDIEDSGQVRIGEKLIIPGGKIVEEKTITKVTSSETSVASTKTTSYSGGGSPVIQAKGGLSPVTNRDLDDYFINPVPSGRYVRGITSSHKGVDLGAPTGTPIKAAAAGTVVFAKKGWNGAYGNLVIIKHDNGARTLYAHMNSIKVSQNAKVYQGEIIGTVGSTGRSTGPHTHFEVLGAHNFLDR